LSVMLSVKNVRSRASLDYQISTAKVKFPAFHRPPAR
jgi:hypothetical protein